MASALCTECRPEREYLKPPPLPLVNRFHNGVVRAFCFMAVGPTPPSFQLFFFCTSFSFLFISVGILSMYLLALKIKFIYMSMHLYILYTCSQPVGRLCCSLASGLCSEFCFLFSDVKFFSLLLLSFCYCVEICFLCSEVLRSNSACISEV